MERNRSYDIHTTHRDEESEIGRLRAQATLTWEKEAQLLARLGLREDMNVLEPGSGPGFITERLLELVPRGHVTALEIDPDLLKKSESYLAGKREGRLRQIQGSVMNTGLPDNTFDFAYARLLFQHLPDPVGAAGELLRVLKPGGKLAIFDADDKFIAFEPGLPEVEPALDLFAQAQAAHGGDRFVGRRLIRILTQAGFEQPDMDAIVMHTDLTGIEAARPQMDADRLLPLVRAGLLAEKQLDELREAATRFLASDPLVVVLTFVASAQKPGAPR